MGIDGPAASPLKKTTAKIEAMDTDPIAVKAALAEISDTELHAPIVTPDHKPRRSGVCVGVESVTACGDAMFGGTPAYGPHPASIAASAAATLAGRAVTIVTTSTPSCSVPYGQPAATLAV